MIKHYRDPNLYKSLLFLPVRYNGVMYYIEEEKIIATGDDPHPGWMGTWKHAPEYFIPKPKAILFLVALLIVLPYSAHAFLGALKNLGNTTSTAFEKSGNKIERSTEEKAEKKPPIKQNKQQAVQSVAEQKKLIGVWESPDTTKGGLGAIYEFREDGGLMAGMGALVNSTYDPKDQNLQQFMNQPYDKSDKDDSRPIKIMDGPLESPSYVGVWKFRHYTGGYAFQKITEDGRMMLRVPFPMPWGKYELKGKKLRFTQAGCPPVDITYKLTEKILELTAPGKKTLRLVRVVPTWYHALTESETEEATTNLQQTLKEDKQKSPAQDMIKNMKDDHEQLNDNYEIINGQEKQDKEYEGYEILH